jgi:hypothetical protein
MRSGLSLCGVRRFGFGRDVRFWMIIVVSWMKYRVLSFEKARLVSCNALGFFRCMGRGLGETWRRPVALPRSLSPPRSALPSSVAAAVLLCVVVGAFARGSSQ